MVAYFTDAGVAQDRITVDGRGQTEPIAENDTEENRQRNRRVEVVLVGVFPSDGDEPTDED